jgi:hypothetical protein
MNNETNPIPAPVRRTVGRSPLKRGNVYAYPGHPGAGFRVQHVCFPGHPEHDGGLAGVSVQWIGHKPGGLSSAFYPAQDEQSFWSKMIFAPAADAPNPEASGRSSVAPTCSTDAEIAK